MDNNGELIYIKFPSISNRSFIPALKIYPTDLEKGSSQIISLNIHFLIKKNIISFRNRDIFRNVIIFPFFRTIQIAHLGGDGTGTNDAFQLEC
jgi:hypothetical protein